MPSRSHSWYVVRNRRLWIWMAKSRGRAPPTLCDSESAALPISVPRKVMAKAKPGPRPSKQVPGKEHYARMQFLHQAATWCQLHRDLAPLARGYTRNRDLVAKKTVLKLAPELKHLRCKQCFTPQIPGLTTSTFIDNQLRLQLRHCDVLVRRCLRCGHHKRFPVGADRDHVPFSQRPDVQCELGGPPPSTVSEATEANDDVH